MTGNKDESVTEQKVRQNGAEMSLSQGKVTGVELGGF